ncbi:hypothetical protein AVEN_64980-1 [Araneus ventricosus]|uniref:Uncharacterized protein n=1 Tax=Araneus ventricosus TaxID=182803 RepID=A0A4Y2U048_ARAVE|nr:hypothetical protein AVEN_64980-1 [Araneus ventricosus]
MSYSKAGGALRAHLLVTGRTPVKGGGVGALAARNGGYFGSATVSVFCFVADGLSEVPGFLCMDMVFLCDTLLGLKFECDITSVDSSIDSKTLFT